ncbi:hypothetical protein FBU30_008155 [Linnemannia zychae]|nr:hypothetical protein FBU30_008155 [Linnemannia zychae]
MTNIVLVHGAITDGSFWNRVIPILLKAGHDVMAVQQPLTSIEDDVAKVKLALETISTGPIILVGYSFGGVVITQAAHGNNNISALVYITAFAPDQGETIAKLAENYKIQLPSTQNFSVDGAGRIILFKDRFKRIFASDIDPADADILAATQAPCDTARFDYVSGPAAWKEHPCYYMITDQDQMIQPEMQVFFAERMRPKKTVKISSSHAVLYSHPQEVANLILEAAAAVDKEK